MITNDLNMLSVPQGRAIGDFGVQDPINAWPGAGPRVLIYVDRMESGGLSQFGYNQGDEANRWQRFRSSAGVWTPWEPVTSAIPPDIYVELAGDQMTGPLLLSGLPTQDAQAASKVYVDTAIAGQPPTSPPPLYQGTWQVAANIPDLTLVTVENGFTWRAVTADPAVPERAPAGIPGIGGQMVSQGDAVTWNAGNNVYDLVPNLSMTQPEADARYVQLTGSDMTGPLVLMPGAPTQNQQAATKLYVDNAVANSGLYQGPWRVAANIPDLIAAAATALNGYTWVAVTADPAVPEQAPAGIPGIAGTMIANGDSIVWNAGTSVYDRLPGGGMTITEADARYLQLAGGVMAGTINMDDVHFVTGLPTPVNNSHAANKAYADTKLAVVQVTGAPALSTLTLRGQYYPAVPYVPADAPAGAGNSWAMEVAAGAAANIWQLFQTGPDAWSRNSTNGGAAWTPWVVLGAAAGAAYLPLVGGTMVGGIDMDGNGIINVPTVPWDATAAVNQTYADTKLPLAGGTMTGDIDMDGNGVINLAAPAADTDAATKAYVDTAVAGRGLYQGLWQVAANTPDLITEAATALNAYTWVAETVDPAVPEQAPAGIPGIGGDMIANGDAIVWNAGSAAYEQHQAGGITQPEADARYLQLAGGAMAGPINMQGRPITQLLVPGAPGDAATKDYVDTAALLLTGGTLTGPLALEPGAPQADNQAVPKSYVDAALAPLAWETVVSLTFGGSSTGGAGQANYMYRSRFETAAFQASGGGKVRVTFAGDGWPFEACIGYGAVAGDPYDFEATPTRLKFGGSNIGQFAATPANNLVASDPVDFVVDPAKSLLVSIKVLTGAGTVGTINDTAQHRGWDQPNGVVDQVNVTGMGNFATDTFAVAKIEQGAGAAAYLPVAGGTMAGAIDMAANKIINVPLPQANGDAASKAYVDNTGGLPIITPAGNTSCNTFLTPGLYCCDYLIPDAPTNTNRGCIWVSRAGNGIWQHLDGFNSASGSNYYRRYYNGASWSAWVADALTQAEADLRYLRLAGGAMTGPLNMAGQKITAVPLPQAGGDAGSKAYIDAAALPAFAVVAGTAFNAMTTSGFYRPVAPYVPGNAPPQPGTGQWACEVRRAGNICWQHLDEDNGERWFRWSLDVNTPVAWGSWQKKALTLQVLPADTAKVDALTARVDELAAKLAALEGGDIPPSRKGKR